jgi:hypothetical protein
VWLNSNTCLASKALSLITVPPKKRKGGGIVTVKDCIRWLLRSLPGPSILKYELNILQLSLVSPTHQLWHLWMSHPARTQNGTGSQCLNYLDKWLSTMVYVRVMCGILNRIDAWTPLQMWHFKVTQMILMCSHELCPTQWWLYYFQTVSLPDQLVIPEQTFQASSNTSRGVTCSHNYEITNHYLLKFPEGYQEVFY